MNSTWYSTPAAVKALSAGSVTQHAISLHFVFWIMLTSTLQAIGSVLSRKTTYLGLLHISLLLLVTVGGLLWSYVANGRQSGREFVNRFAFIALPLTIRTTILYEAFYWIPFRLFPFMARGMDDATYEVTWLTYAFLLPILCDLLWYWRMTVWMRRIREARS